MIRVALCDDDAVFLDKLYRAVKEWFQKNRPEQKAEIEVFHDGKALLDSTEKSFDIFFLDIEMPKMNGIETFERMKEFAAGTPVIFLTASGQEDDVVSAIRLGAVNYLKKPFPPQELILRISQVLEKR